MKIHQNVKLWLREHNKKKDPKEVKLSLDWKDFTFEKKKRKKPATEISIVLTKVPKRDCI